MRGLKKIVIGARCMLVLAAMSGVGTFANKKVHRELCQIRDEQKTFGKIHVNTELQPHI